MTITVPEYFWQILVPLLLLAIMNLNTFGIPLNYFWPLPEVTFGPYLNTFGKEKVLGQVAAEGGEATRLLQQVAAHEGRHACGAVDPQQVGRQVDARMARTKVHLPNTPSL